MTTKSGSNEVDVDELEEEIDQREQIVSRWVLEEKRGKEEGRVVVAGVMPESHSIIPLGEVTDCISNGELHFSNVGTASC